MLEKLEINLQHAFPIFSLHNVKQLIGFPLDQTEKKSEKDFQSHLKKFKIGNKAMILGSAIALESAFDSFKRISSVTQSSLRFKSDVNIVFSWKESPVGKYVLVVRSQGNQASVRFIADGHINELPRDIFFQVLDGANIVDYTSVSHGGVDTYFFTKENLWQSSEDIKALYRLGPLVNLTTHDTQTDSGMTMDVKVYLDGAVVNIRYGTSAENEKGRILRHAYKTLSRRVWAREKDSPNSSYNWDVIQRQQLMHKGNVDGFEVVYKRDPQTYPELANDLENTQIIVKQSSQRQRSFEN